MVHLTFPSPSVSSVPRSLCSSHAKQWSNKHSPNLPDASAPLWLSLLAKNAWWPPFHLLNSYTSVSVQLKCSSLYSEPLAQINIKWIIIDFDLLCTGLSFIAHEILGGQGHTVLALVISVPKMEPIRQLMFILSMNESFIHRMTTLVCCKKELLLSLLLKPLKGCCSLLVTERTLRDH